MKNYLIPALITISTLSSVSALAQECAQAKPIEVQYAMEYLSIMERGGLGLTDGVVPNFGRTAEEICTDTKEFVINLGRDGSEDVVLGFKDQTCTVTMNLVANNRIESISLVGCEAAN